MEQPSNPPLALLDRQLSSGVGFGGERDRVGEWGMKSNRGMKKGTDCRLRVREREREKVRTEREREKEERKRSVSVKRTTVAKERRREREVIYQFVVMCERACESEKTV